MALKRQDTTGSLDCLGFLPLKLMNMFIFTPTSKNFGEKSRKFAILTTGKDRALMSSLV